MMRVLLFLFSNNFFSYANYIVLIMMVYEIIVRRKLSIVKTPAFAFLVAGSLMFMLLSLYNSYEISASTFMLRFVTPIFLFYIGYTRGLLGYDSLKLDILVIMFATLIHGLLNVLTNRNVNVLLINGRPYQDIYGGPISATLQNLMFVLSSSLLFYFLVYEKKKKLKIIAIIAILCGVYGSIANASRTLLYVTALVFFMCLFLHMILTHNIVSGIMRAVIICIVLYLIVILVVWLNLFGVQEWFMNTPLGRREATALPSSSVSQNMRWKYAGDILALLPQYPLGKIPYGNYAHNLWVDIAKETGIIPFVLYILFAVASLAEGVKYFFLEKKNPERAVTIAAVMVAYLLVFFTEPIMEGSPMTFAIFCFIVGGVSSLRRRTN